MKVFISWSGELSHKVALCLREWVSDVIQIVKPYVSSEDIDKGERWSTNVARELKDTKFGILCVTKDNFNAPWLMFEAGALSKSMEESYVVPFLFGIKRSELSGPILQFQYVTYEQEDIKKMMVSLNKACGENGLEEHKLDIAFERCYPSLREQLDELSISDSGSATSDGDDGNEVEASGISSSHVIEELLELSRSNQKLLQSIESKLNNEGKFFIPSSGNNIYVSWSDSKKRDLLNGIAGRLSEYKLDGNENYKPDLIADKNSSIQFLKYLGEQIDK